MTTTPSPSPVTSQPVPQEPPRVRPSLFFGVYWDKNYEFWDRTGLFLDADEAFEDIGNLVEDTNKTIITIPGEVEEARDRKRWEAAMEVIRLARDLTTGIGQGSRLDTACKAFDALEGA